jgi:hypothetical protein
MVTIQWNATDNVGVTSVDIGYVKDQKLFGISTGGIGRPSTLREINPSNGSTVIIGDVGFNHGIALECDPRSGMLYAVGERPADSTHVLLTVDPLTGAGTEIGPTGVVELFTDLAFEPWTGELYGHVGPDGSPNEIYTIDLASGSATLVGDLGEEGFGGGLEFGWNGDLYATLTSGPDTEIYRISPATAAPIDIRTLEFPPAYSTNPVVREIDRNPLLSDANCLYMDESSINMRLGQMVYYSSSPKIVDVAVTYRWLRGIAWGPGDCIDIATGEPNDGSYLWTVPDDPTGMARVKITAHDAIGNTAFDMIDGFCAIVNTTDAGRSGPPRASFLSAAAPNPFVGETTIRFGLSTKGRVQLSVYDIRGRQIKVLLAGEYAAGERSLRWNGRDDAGSRVASGSYIIRLKTDQGVHTRRVSLVR